MSTKPIDNEQLTYDEAMARIETIVKQLEQSEAISLDEYRHLATEAKRLLDYCRAQIQQIADELKVEA